MGGQPADVAVGAGAVWVADSARASVVRVDGGRRQVTGTITGIGPNPRALAIVGRDVWVATAGDGRVWRVDSDANAVAGSVRVGGQPRDITTDGEHLWVTDRERDRVIEIDASSARVVRSARRWTAVRSRSQSTTAPCGCPASTAARSRASRADRALPMVLGRAEGVPRARVNQRHRALPRKRPLGLQAVDRGQARGGKPERVRPAVRRVVRVGSIKLPQSPAAGRSRRRSGRGERPVSPRT